jgi:zona occludens toxin
MISLIFGFPGSGKSYYAVEKIFNILSSTKESNFEIIYTNIGGVKFDNFPDSKIQFKKLKEDELIVYLTQCFKLYEQYKNFENVDDYLIEFSKKMNFYNALIVFDECHDFFSNQDRIKIFWLTYHRHLNHEIILLTQNKSLINSKYRAIPEQFIEAQPRSKKIFSNTLNYKHYASFAMRNTDLFNKSSIKVSQEIFNLYQSGNKSNQKSIILKFIFIFLGGILIAAALFLYLFNSFNTPIEDEIKKEIEVAPQIQREIKSNHLKPTINEDMNDSFQEEYFNIYIEYESDKGYLIKDKYYRDSYFDKFLNRTKSKILIKNLIFETTDYKFEKLLLRTSNKDLKEFFYIEETININKKEFENNYIDRTKKGL